jgi:TRAP-type transport system periplasmic protein
MKKQQGGCFMKKVIFLVAVVVFCFGISVGVSHGADKIIQLEFSIGLPPGNSQSVLWKEFCDEVEKETNGRVKMGFHPGNTLTPSHQAFDAVVNQIADIAYAPIGTTPGKFPVSEVVEMPLGVKSAEMATNLWMDLLKKFQFKEFESVKLLGVATGGPTVFLTKKPVRKLEDLKGMKIRCGGGMQVKTLQLLGAVPVNMQTMEVYDGLQKGVIEGVVIPVAAMTSGMKWGEVVKNVTFNRNTNFVYGVYFVMNKKKWDSLPLDIQQTIGKLGHEYAIKTAKLYDHDDMEAIKSLPKMGAATINLSKEEEERWSKAVAPVYDEYIKDKSAKGIPAAEIVKFCQDWVKKNQK